MAKLGAPAGARRKPPPDRGFLKIGATLATFWRLFTIFNFYHSRPWIVEDRYVLGAFKPTLYMLSISTIRGPLVRLAKSHVTSSQLTESVFGESVLARLGILLFEYIKVNEKGGG
jgi:hypothetical protein